VGWRGLKPPSQPRSLLKFEGRRREKKGNKGKEEGVGEG
jgi:hypothetical protein